MIQYEGHALERNRSGVDGQFVHDPVSPDAVGRRVASDQIESRAVGSGGFDAEYARSLSKLIESEIIPRLMVAHAAVVPVAVAIESKTVIGAGETEAFAALVLQLEVDALLAHVELILARGVAIDTVLVDLLAPTARLLGAFWEDERCDFVDVTMGFWRLQEIVHEISERLPVERRPFGDSGRALFASNPRDQHSFGTVANDDGYLPDGWLSDRFSAAETAGLRKRVGDDWFDKMGLTVSGDCHIGRSPAIIAALRNLSRNTQG